MELLKYPSNVDEGLSLLPIGLRDEDTDAFLGVYLRRYDALQDTLTAYLNQLITWDVDGADTPDFILGAIGKLLNQPRPDGATREEYRRILKIRRLVRLSKATQPDIRRVVAALGNLGGGARVDFLIPHTIVVTFANFADLESQGFSLTTTTRLLLDTIGSVDRLQIWDAVGNVFAWDIEGQGWQQGVWATPLFDSED